MRLFVTIMLTILVFYTAQFLRSQIKPVDTILPRAVTTIPSSTPTDTPVLNDIWHVVNRWRVANGYPEYIRSDVLCDIAEKRLIEIQSDWSHNGFWKYTKQGLFTDQGENLSRYFTNNYDILDAWLASPTHRENLTGPFIYSCIRCVNSYCAQEFGI